MTLRQRLEGFFKDRILERPAKRRGLQALRDKLRADEAKLSTRFANAPGTEANRKALRHIIAIERWGQGRLRVALGEPLLEDTNHDYKPPKETSWSDLGQQFSETRDQTLKLADALIEVEVDPGQTVPHNQLGPLSVAGWLRYLNVHASLEAKRIR